jgi:hypothetical protein
MGAMCYVSTALREYKLTRNQLNITISQNLVYSEEVVNPHYRSGPPATLVSRGDIQKNIETIRTFSRYGEEERQQRQYYALRSKVRKSLAVECPVCGELVHAKAGSLTFENAVV